MTEETIVSAVGTVSGAGGVDSNITPKEIEEAMAAAVIKAMNEGITDPDEIRRRQLEARDEVVKSHGTS